MRLLFLNYEFPPVGGGAAYASLATARELVSMGHRVDFLTAGNDSAHDTEIDGVQVHRVRAYRRGVHESGLMGAIGFVALAAMRLRALARQNRYDAYHYYFGLPTGLLSRLPGLHRRRPYVVSLRGSDVPGYDPGLAVHHKLMLPLTRRIWRGAYQIVANSQDLRRLALTSAPEMSIEVIANASAAPTAGMASRLPHKGLRILAVSRLIPRKGLDTLIMALARSHNQDLSVDIAGDGPEGDKLRRLAQACGVGDRVRFHGFMDHAGLAALHAQADLFVLASVSESCSMALLEAMAAGLPLIATKVGGTTELVQHGVNGLLINAQDVDELCGAIQTLARDPLQRERLAAANRALVRARYSWHSVARRYEAIFQAASNRQTQLDAAAGGCVEPTACQDREA